MDVGWSSEPSSVEEEVEATDALVIPFRMPLQPVCAFCHAGAGLSAGNLPTIGFEPAV